MCCKKIETKKKVHISTSPKLNSNRVVVILSNKQFSPEEHSLTGTEESLLQHLISY